MFLLLALLTRCSKKADQENKPARQRIEQIGGGGGEHVPCC